MVKIGFSLQPQYDCSIECVIQELSKTGFTAVSPVFSKEIDLKSIVFYTYKHNMTVQSLHAPHLKSSRLWNSKDPLAHKYKKIIYNCIDDCVRFQIPTIVIHGWGGFDYVFFSESLDFKIFDQIINYAEKKGVYIAFENLEGEEYLEALLTRYEDRPHIGYCWDSGHDHCYTHELNFLEKFGSRLIMTHIHDNFGPRDPNGIPSGDDDLHFLPFDGNINWENELKRFKGLPRQYILNFELKKTLYFKGPKRPDIR